MSCLQDVLQVAVEQWLRHAAMPGQQANRQWVVFYAWHNAVV
jgi:hypothetical protein